MTKLARLTGILAVVMAAAGPASAAAQDFATSAGRLRAEVVATGLDHPWSLAFLPDGGLLVTERPGRLRIVRDGRLGPPVDGVPAVWARGQGGLLDVVTAPDFAETGRIYLSYSRPGPGGRGPR